MSPRPRLTATTLLILFSLLAAAAQSPNPTPALTLPPGITLPVGLAHGIQAGKTKPGTPVVAGVTQRVPLGPDSDLPRHCQVLGTVLASQPDELTLHFNTLRCPGVQIPLHVRVLAIAGMMAVDETFSPAAGTVGPGDGDPANWTTQQVGGDLVWRSNWIGQLLNGATHRVGFADFHGVYADPPPGASGPAAIPHALGVFSASARGLYGYDPDTTMSSTDDTLTLHAPKPPHLRAGDNLLLQVLTPEP